MVSAVQHDPGRTFSQVVATPLAHLNRSREVLLVWPGETTTILDPAEPEAGEVPDTSASDDTAAASPDAQTGETTP